MTKKVLAAVLAVSAMLPHGVGAECIDRFDGHWGLDTIRLVIFASDGGTYIPPAEKEIGTVIHLDEYIPVKEGYIFDGWYSDPRTKVERVTEVTLYNQFAVYLNSVGYSAYILPKPKNRYNEYVPHIFTEEEIKRIYYAADTINAKRLNSYQRIMPVLVRLLFSTGLRISEAINLKCSDINFTTGILYLYDCKNGEDRIVPMHQTLLEYLKEYANEYIHDNEYFFETIHHTQITAATCYKKFRDILFSAGIPHGGRGKGPRLHDTRHSFAVHSLRHMINQGMDIYVSLPYLSVYLGHKSIEATENYIRLTAEAYPELAALVNQYTGHVIPEV